MIGRMLSVGLDTNPIIVDNSDKMSQYLSEQYSGMFIKYTGSSTTEYKNGYIYKVSKKQDGTDTVYFFAPYFYLETLESPADESKVIDGYQAYNDHGEKIEGQYKISEKVITENGTYYPADDSVNAYNKITVNVAGGTAENPYIATTDTEMDSYLAEKYKDSFVRVDYAKYHITLPATATTTTAIFKYENIGISRMCAYIDKWLGAYSKKTILELKGIGETATITYTTTAYKILNADNTYGYAIAFTHNASSDSNSESNSTPLFLYNIKSGTEIDGYTADQDWYVGWTNFGGDTESPTIETVNEIITATLTNFSGAYTIAIDDALVLTNMAGSETDNKYIEDGVYKIVPRYSQGNVYVAESPFEVGDAFVGATMYVNQAIIYDEFYAMVETISEAEFAPNTVTYIFLNQENPYPVSENDDYGAMIAPTIAKGDGASLIAYAAIADDPYIISPNNEAPTKTSITIPESIEIDGTTYTTPATITKINRPDIFNAIFGKTANFTKSLVAVTNYTPELQLSNGAFEEAQSETKLDARATNDNIGKIYQYTGATGTKYTNQALYIVMED